MTRRNQGIRCTGLLAACVLALSSLPAWSAPMDASAWLARMQNALAHRSYRGVLVFMGQGGPLTYQLVVSDGTYARMSALTGPSREIIRGPEVVIRLRPNGRVMVIRGMGGGASPLPFPPATRVAGSVLKQSYRLKLGGVGRVAGEKAQIMRIVPRDHWRYGYRVWISTKSGLPLRSELVTAEGHTLQQAFFTHLNLIEAPAAMSAIGAQEIAMLNKVTRRGDARAGACRHGQDRFSFKNLPPGFELLKTVCELAPYSGVPVTHMLIGDGLATVSLFVTLHRKGGPVLIGTTTIGAVHAVGRIEGSFALTAMGDAPISTVTRIARSLVVTRQ
ncbi:MAG: MucB/RseB C-terminal domain-containing protein [Gammaproteobacteria bacterium]|nr:MucB/RseB C-terminal domain-containing protein [Gammaproteobacteria bacterium]